MEGYRVLDLSDGKAYLCGAILAHLGADVVKIEPPGGDSDRNTGPFLENTTDPQKSLSWLAMNAGKRGITLALEKAEGKSLLKRLVKNADFLIESFPPGYLQRLGLDYQSLSRINSSLVFVSISPFGQTGPYRDFKTSPLVALATAGYLYTTGDTDRPPVNINVPLAYLLTSLDAAVAALMAHYYRGKTGEGQYVDVSIQHCSSWLSLRPRFYYALKGKVIHRSGTRYQYTPGVGRRRIFECKDGSITFGLVGGATGEVQNRLLSQWLREEGLSSEFLDGMTWEKVDISELAAKMEEGLSSLFKRYTKAELTAECKRRGLILGPIYTVKELLANQQLKARNFWEQIEYPELGCSLTYPGAFFKSSLTSCVRRRRAPMVGEHNEEVLREIGVSEAELQTLREKAVIQSTDSSGEGVSKRLPLDGVKVLDFTWVMTGPQVTRCLADFGATVIKVESHTYPDQLRAQGPYKDGTAGFNRSFYFADINCNKYSLSLNLKKPRAMDVLKKLVSWSDVVVENFTPGTMERWGIGYHDLTRIKPDIIMISLSLQGQTGPESQVPGWGSVAEGLSGLADLSGWPDRPPSISQHVWGDAVTPRFGLIALLTALDYRRRTGQGQYIDVCQLESLVYLLGTPVLDYAANGRVTTRSGNWSDSACPHGVYPCRGEDEWCAISITTDEEWQSLCQVMGTDGIKDSKFATFVGRKRNEPQLDRLLGEWTGNYEPLELMETLQKHGVTAGIASSPAELNQDPQLRHRGFWRLEHPEVGQFDHDTWGFQLALTPAEPRMPAPRLGEHSHFVCTQILGLPEEEFIELTNEGVFD